ncbi:MAG: sugar transporter [Alphaproteobacteria bacterium HGW-Alphaproteobacteria-2]|nr:MAG: sugar transporter [Alphaproteobacteria bacterium HGW-Alphaproteobacteria-2]
MIKFLAGFALAIGLALPALAQGTYQISPGDALQVEVLEDPSLNRTVLVLPDGTISFPLAGTVRVAGRSVAAAGQALASRMAGNFAVEPTVYVSLAALAQREAQIAAENLISVYAVGEVNAPGRKEVEPGTTLLQLIAEANGLSRFAAEKRLRLRRTDPKTGEETVFGFNYRSMGGPDSVSGSMVLMPGDVLVVPERRLFE